MDTPMIRESGGRRATPVSASRGNATRLRVMSDIFATPAVRAGVGVVILCFLSAAGFYLVSIFRDYAAQDQEGTEESLAKLLEMHRKGDISDEEFRTIESRTHRPPVGPSTIDDSTSSDDSSPSSQA
jgi:uncharacterized membrane protein